MIRQKVFRTGNSLVVVIPVKLREKFGIQAGDTVVVKPDSKTGQLTLVFPQSRQLVLMKKD